MEGRQGVCRLEVTSRHCDAGNSRIVDGRSVKKFLGRTTHTSPKNFPKNYCKMQYPTIHSKSPTSHRTPFTSALKPIPAKKRPAEMIECTPHYSALGTSSRPAIAVRSSVATRRSP